MPNITYNVDIPFRPNNPSYDQPLMQVNTNAINTWMNVDHYGFNNNDGGNHRRVVFPNNITAGTNAGIKSTLNTQQGPGTASSEAFFNNKNGSYPYASVKAFGSFTTLAAAAPQTPFSPIIGSNIVSITPSSASKIYTIALTPGAVVGTNVCIIWSQQFSPGMTFSYSYALDTITFTNTNVTGTTTISFEILQV